MQDLYEKLYIVGLPMKPVAIFLGILLIILHGLALFRPTSFQAALKRFPRNKPVGVALMVIVGVWAWFLLKEMDMGEFYKMRLYVLIAAPALCAGMIIYANEFLSVRALGCLLLLGAAVILQSAFQKDPWIPKLLLPILAYAWILKGLFYVGMPYLMRNGISWVTQNGGRWKIGAALGLIYGLALIVMAFTQYTT